MSELIAIAYPDEQQASKILDAVKQLNDSGAIDLESAVALTKDGAGKVQVENAFGSSLTKGAVGGLVLGTIVGLILFAPVAGALFGVASGALAGKLDDVGQIDEFRTQVGDSMPPGSSAILMVARAADPEQGLAVLRQYGGKLIHTSLPDDAEARIRAALAPPAAGAA